MYKWFVWIYIFYYGQTMDMSFKRRKYLDQKNAEYFQHIRI